MRADIDPIARSFRENVIAALARTLRHEGCGPFHDAGAEAAEALVALGDSGREEFFSLTFDEDSGVRLFAAAFLLTRFHDERAAPIIEYAARGGGRLAEFASDLLESESGESVGSPVMWTPRPSRAAQCEARVSCRALSRRRSTRRSDC